jgi:hypothetical protein
MTLSTLQNLFLLLIYGYILPILIFFIIYYSISIIFKKYCDTVLLYDIGRKAKGFGTGWHYKGAA